MKQRAQNLLGALVACGLVAILALSPGKSSADEPNSEAVAP